MVGIVVAVGAGIWLLALGMLTPNPGDPKLVLALLAYLIGYPLLLTCGIGALLWFKFIPNPLPGL